MSPTIDKMEVQFRVATSLDHGHMASPRRYQRTGGSYRWPRGDKLTGLVGWVRDGDAPEGKNELPPNTLITSRCSTSSWRKVMTVLLYPLL